MTAASPTARTLLIVDDEASLREMLKILFKRDGYEVTVAAGVRAARDALKNAVTPFAAVLTDLMMPDGSGTDVLVAAHERSPQTEVIVMTAHSTVEAALEVMRAGAYDFVTKPFQNAELKVLLGKALEKHTLGAENVRLRAQVERQTPAFGLLGRSRAMTQVMELVMRIKDSRTTVLITGESGTGKERVARAIHDASERRNAPFLVVNCGAIPENLIESELFGVEKGAFTGATQRRLGIFREAEGGTVLLDELGELPAPMQVKLLRVLQEKKVRGVGETAESAIDVRVLAATNRPVEEDVKSGRLRQDLYYRLNVIRLELPPLRERREDVPALLDHFLTRAAHEHGKELRELTPDARRALDRYDFPGNVRELENIVERATALAVGPAIGIGDLPREVSGQAAAPTAALGDLSEQGCMLEDVLAEFERRLILQALARTAGVRTTAAKLLGVSFRSLRYRMAKLGFAEDDSDASEAASDSEPGGAASSAR